MPPVLLQMLSAIILNWRRIQIYRVISKKRKKWNDLCYTVISFLTSTFSVQVWDLGGLYISFVIRNTLGHTL